MTPSPRFAPLTVLLGVVLALSSSARCAAQTTIDLRTSVRLDADAKPGAQTPLTLGHVATITGTDADRLSGIILHSDLASAAPGSTWTTVDIAQVRAALENAGGGVNLGRIIVRGSSCTVRFADPTPPTSQTRTPTPARRADKPLQVIDTTGPATIKTMIAQRLADMFGVATTDLRLAFSSEDEALISAPVGSRRVDLRPAASANSARIPMWVYISEADRMVVSKPVTVEAEVRRNAYSATSTIDRNQVIDQSMLTVSEHWVAPSDTPPATLEQIVGSTARARIAPGQLIDTNDVAAPLACKRGDIVYVHCLNGPVHVQAKARALGSARDGEIVQLKLVGGDDVFTARMSGRGHAMLVMDAPPDVPAPPAPTAPERPTP